MPVQADQEQAAQQTSMEIAVVQHHRLDKEMQAEMHPAVQTAVAVEQEQVVLQLQVPMAALAETDHLLIHHGD